MPEIVLTSKQTTAIEYLEDEETIEVLFGGAAGGAKSFLGCYWVTKNCIRYPGSRWLIGRSVLKRLKETTLNTWFDLAKKLEMVNGHHYKYNSQEGVITFFNDSQIILKDLFAYQSDPNFDNLGSLEITGAFLDECNQISLLAKETVKSRIRYKLDEFGLKPKLLMSCNPAKNWVYSDFYKPNKEGVLERVKKFVQALVRDNPFISKHYIENLKSLKSKAQKERLLFGNWEYDDSPDALLNYDCILDAFTNSHVEAKGEKYITADIALQGSDKLIILVWHGWVVIDYTVVDKANGKEVIDKIKDLKEKHKVGNSNIVYDNDGVGGFIGGFMENARGFKNGGKPIGDENFENLKTQCAYKLTEMINNREIWLKALVEVRELVVEEMEQLKSRDKDKDGKLKIATKDEMKVMLGRSPDWLDNLIYRMYFKLKPNRVTPII